MITMVVLFITREVVPALKGPCPASVWNIQLCASSLPCFKCSHLQIWRYFIRYSSFLQGLFGRLIPGTAQSLRQVESIMRMHCVPTGKQSSPGPSTNSPGMKLGKLGTHPHTPKLMMLTSNRKKPKWCF
jgi:hypothetical protein